MERTAETINRRFVKPRLNTANPSITLRAVAIKREKGREGGGKTVRRGKKKIGKRGLLLDAGKIATFLVRLHPLHQLDLIIRRIKKRGGKKKTLNGKRGKKGRSERAHTNLAQFMYQLLQLKKATSTSRTIEEEKRKRLL